MCGLKAIMLMDCFNLLACDHRVGEADAQGLHFLSLPLLAGGVTATKPSQTPQKWALCMRLEAA